LTTLSAEKIDRHPRCSTICAPMIGATAVATAIAILSVARRRISVVDPELSRAIARPSTSPEQPPSACASRAHSSPASDGAKAAATLATANSDSPARSTGRRP
jgi:hypothetical protein